MNIEQLEELDSYNLDLIVESLQYRLEDDTNLMYHPDIKSDLEDMCAKLRFQSKCPVKESIASTYPSSRPIIVTPARDDIHETPSINFSDHMICGSMIILLQALPPLLLALCTSFRFFRFTYIDFLVIDFLSSISVHSSTLILPVFGSRTDDTFPLRPFSFLDF